MNVVTVKVKSVRRVASLRLQRHSGSVPAKLVGISECIVVSWSLYTGNPHYAHSVDNRSTALCIAERGDGYLSADRYKERSENDCLMYAALTF
jgi:hypothetical protein